LKIISSIVTQKAIPYTPRIHLGARMKPVYLILLICGFINLAQADIYKRVDSSGVTYSSEPLKGGQKIILGPIPAMQAPAPSRPVSANSPNDFPRVDANTQRTRDQSRFQILKDELTAEERALSDARKAESNDQIRLHTKNIDALKTEIANLKP
jgi:hypothetical protein